MASIALLGEAACWLAAAGFVLAVIAGQRAPVVRTAARIATVSLAIATVLLASAFVRSDFALLYVIDHARADVGPITRIGGLWAGPEGSLVLFVTMLAGWTLALRTAKPAPVLHGLLAFLSVTVAAVASPFEAAPQVLATGSGLQPILEHPAMAYHPPLLYAGVTGVLAVGLAALSSPDRSQRLERLERLVLALTCIGLVSGSRWAFAEVGWGGYWAWDPIENGALIAWMFGLGALHVNSERRRLVWSMAGLAALWSTVLTRVGVVSSVHSFANDPGLRRALIATAVIVTIAALAVLFGGRATLVTRGRKLTWSKRLKGRPLAVGVLVGSGLLTALGTYKPLVGWAVSGSTSMVGGHYFMIVLLVPVLVGLAGLVRFETGWGAKPNVAAGAGAFLLCAILGSGAPLGSYVLVAGGGAVAGSGLLAIRRRPRALAHVGIGLALAGVGGSVHRQSDIRVLAVGEPAQWQGQAIEHLGIDLAEGSSMTEATSTMLIGDRQFTPSLRSFPNRGVGSAEVDTHLSWRGEYHVVFQDGDAERSRYQLTFVPLLWLVWLGGVVTAFGLVAPRSWRNGR